MIRSVVGTAFAGFQKAAVSGEFDEHELQIRTLRQELHTLEGVVRQLLVEVASLRGELGQLRASGLRAPEPAERAAPAAELAPARTAPPPPAAPSARVDPPAQEDPAASPARAAAPPATPEAPKAPPVSIAALAAQAASGQLEQTRHADDHSTDLEGYRERMRANGREDVPLAGEGLNVADDGTPFIGPVDNESSRARARGRVLTIDQWECISCGTCVEQTADVFHLPDGEKAEVLKQEGPMDLIQDAIDACPVTCISWLDRDKLAEQHSAGGI